MSEQSEQEVYRKIKSKYLGKEVKLLEMDDYIAGELEFADSVFDDLDHAIMFNGWVYALTKGNFRSIDVGFKFITDMDSDPDIREVVVKVDSVRLI